MLGIQELLTVVERVKKINRDIIVSGVLITFAEHTVLFRGSWRMPKRSSAPEFLTRLSGKTFGLPKLPVPIKPSMSMITESIGATDYLNFVREFISWRNQFVPRKRGLGEYVPWSQPMQIIKSRLEEIEDLGQPIESPKPPPPPSLPTGAKQPSRARTPGRQIDQKKAHTNQRTTRLKFFALWRKQLMGGRNRRDLQCLIMPWTL